MQVPDIHYATSGDLRLAYQQWGDGPPLLIVPALLSNMAVSWEHEYLTRIYARFVDRGEHTLKGIDGAWRLFAVEA